MTSYSLPPVSRAEVLWTEQYDVEGPTPKIIRWERSHESSAVVWVDQATGQRADWVALLQRGAVHETHPSLEGLPEFPWKTASDGLCDAKGRLFAQLSQSKAYTIAKIMNAEHRRLTGPPPAAPESDPVNELAIADLSRELSDILGEVRALLESPDAHARVVADSKLRDRLGRDGTMAILRDAMSRGGQPEPFVLVELDPAQVDELMDALGGGELRGARIVIDEGVKVSVDGGTWTIPIGTVRPVRPVRPDR